MCLFWFHMHMKYLTYLTILLSDLDFWLSDYLFWLLEYLTWLSECCIRGGDCFLRGICNSKINIHPTSKCNWFVDDVFFVVNLGSYFGKVQYGVLLIKVRSAIGLGKFQNCWNQKWSPLFLCLAKVPIFKCQNMALCIFLIVFVLFFLLHRQKKL